jgi:hypothetical protein
MSPGQLLTAEDSAEGHLKAPLQHWPVGCVYREQGSIEEEPVKVLDVVALQPEYFDLGAVGQACRIFILSFVRLPPFLFEFSQPFHSHFKPFINPFLDSI